jgi:hypothetical protein
MEAMSPRDFTDSGKDLPVAATAISKQSKTEFPSQHDIALTRELVEAGKLFRIPIVEHVIVTEEGVLSIARTWKPERARGLSCQKLLLWGRDSTLLRFRCGESLVQVEIACLSDDSNVRSPIKSASFPITSLVLAITSWWSAFQ